MVVVNIESNIVEQQWQIDLFMCIEMYIFNQNTIRGRMTTSICIYVFVDMYTCVNLKMRKRIVVSSIRVKLRSGIRLSHRVDCDSQVRVSPQRSPGVGVKGVGEGKQTSNVHTDSAPIIVSAMVLFASRGVTNLPVPVSLGRARGCCPNSSPLCLLSIRRKGL